MPRRRQHANRSQQNAQDQGTTQGSVQGSGVGNQAAQGGQSAQSGGVMGWFRDAGRWLGDTASSAVETVGGWAEDTKDAARELWEAAATTDFSWKDGRIRVETDLDEVLDIVPDHLRAGLSLDRAGAENRVAVELNTETRELVITSEALVISSFESESLRTGTVTLSGVRVVLSNHEGGLPFLGGDFSMLGYSDKDDKLAAAFTVGSASATDVHWTGEGGPVSVQSLQLQGLTGNIASGPALPGAEGATAELGFDIEGAVLQGLRSEGHMASSISVSDAAGGISASGESAFLEAGQVDIAGAATGDSQLGAAQASGLRIDVQNTGGGAPFIDSQADKARARVAVEAASISDFDGAEADVDRASVAGLSASYDTTTGGAALFAHDLQASGVDSSWIDVNTLDLDDAGMRFGSEGGSNRLSVEARRAATDGLHIDSPEGGDSATSSVPLDWSADVGEVAMTDTQAAGARIGGARAQQLHAAGRADGARSTYGARAATMAVDDVDHALLQADSLSGTNAAFQGDARRVATQADHIRGTGIAAHQFTAGELNGWGLDATMGTGAAALSLDRARVADARIADRLSVQEGAVDGLQATHDAGMNTVSIDHASVAGVTDDTTGTTLGAAELSGARTAGDPQAFETTIDSAALTDLRSAELSVAQAAVTGASASRADGTTRGGLDTVSATGLTVGGRARIDSLEASGLRGDTDGTRHRAQLGQATATGLSDRETGAQAASLRLGGGQATLTGDHLDASLDSLAARGLAQGDRRLASLDAAGLRAQGQGQDWSGGVDRADAAGLAVGDQLAADTLRARGLAATTSADRLNATATSVGGDGILARGGGSQARVGSVDVAGLGLAMDGQGTTGGAQRVAATGLDLRSSGGTSGGGGLPGLDTARLVETLAPRVQYADARLQGDLAAGELGGGLKARRGTTVDANLQVRNNQFVPGANAARFNQPLQGPLWTGVNGVAQNRDGRVEADVSGWFDQDVTGTINESLGLRGEAMPSVGQIGSGVAGIMRQPSSGDSGGGSPLQNLRGSASVGLYGGEIDAGRAGGVTLDHAQRAGDNQVDATFGPGGMDVAVRRFLARSARLDTGSTALSTGPATASGLQASTRGDSTTARADSVQLDELRFSDDQLRR